MGLLFLFAGINNAGLGGTKHRGKGSTRGWIMVGISELLEKFLSVFSFFIFCPKRVGAVTVGGKGDGAGRSGRDGAHGMPFGAWWGLLGQSLAPFWSLALTKMGMNPSGSSRCPSLGPPVILPGYLPQKTPQPMCRVRQNARPSAITKPA